MKGNLNATVYNDILDIIVLQCLVCHHVFDVSMVTGVLVIWEVYGFNFQTLVVFVHLALLHLPFHRKAASLVKCWI